MTRVKICGNTEQQQVDLCVDAGADCLGFVVEYPVAVPWNLAREEARPLLCRVPPMIGRAVVTGGEPEHVLEIASTLLPHCVQLHTDNTLEETALLAKELARMGIDLIRALRIDATSGIARGEIADPVHAALALQDARAAAILLDACTVTMPAGTGTRVDWSIACRIRKAVHVPLILAGGLTPQNVARAIEQVRPYAVDVISGVEASRRVKDADLVRQFVANAHAAYAS
ncbi:MAG: phosphoribosylanthranilate isomerase [Thermoguttaceae bacterium]|jgi:phosphoribosylanthranilate isomerase|nr:phosphoribosylanthranilate isomerase [Thermoguttaceae bacterium]